MKTFYRNLILFLIIGSFCKKTTACGCPGGTDFCSSINHSILPKPDLIIKGVKLFQANHGMGVKILDVISGVSPKDTIMVWGDNGVLCRVYTWQFNDSDTLILSLFYTDMTGNMMTGGVLEQTGDYMLSVCGKYYLNVIDDNVVGQIFSSSITSMPYNSFKSSLANCILSNGTDNSDPLEGSMTISPNPFTDFSALRFTLNTRDNVSIKIYNVFGQPVNTLVDEFLIPGEHTFYWRGNDNDGNKVAGGMYYYVISTTSQQVAKSMIFIGH